MYGTKGAPAAGNIPGGRDGASSWTDDNGRFWLFGGVGIDGTGTDNWLDDLWEFNPSTKEWKWMGGAGAEVYWPLGGVYGKLGTPASGNLPGSRRYASSWTDGNGHLWLFGGAGYDAKGTRGSLNDLWEFDPAINEWSWMSGGSAIPSSGGQPGVYGTFKVSAVENVPGSRVNATSWTDGIGNLWLFGGEGYDAGGNLGQLNDLWEFNPSTKEWAWMGGSSTTGQLGVYGTLGEPAAGSIPGGRFAATSWIDGQDSLWLLGGQGLDENAYVFNLNDLWEFDASTIEWVWMGGSSTVEGIDGPAGVYGTSRAAAAADRPSGRNYAASWTDKYGDLWLFGGKGVDAKGTLGALNDLWVFQPTVGSLPAITPVFTLTPGGYTSPLSIKIADSTPGATVYYTLDGSTPSDHSKKYSAAIPIEQRTVVKAIAKANDFADSAVATATYTILKPQAITLIAPAGPVTYGAKPFNLSVKASSGLKVELTVLAGRATVSGHELTITGAGTIIIAASQPGNSDYAAAKEIKQTLTVKKAALKVRASNLYMVKGGKVPDLTYVIDGFVNGDKRKTATTGAPKLTTTATSSSPAGKYPVKVTAGTLKAKNYTFTFDDGTLTVN